MITLYLPTDPSDTTIISQTGKFSLGEIFGLIILQRCFKIKNQTIQHVKFSPENIPENTFEFALNHKQFNTDKQMARENGIAYATAGMMWKHLGKDWLKELCNCPERTWEIIDEKLIQDIDQMENNKNFNPANTNVTEIVALWDAKDNCNNNFLDAVSYADIAFGKIFTDALTQAEEEKTIDDAINEAKNHVMILEKYLSWHKLLFNSKNEKAKEIYYIISPAKENGFHWQCVPKELGSVESRKASPEEWWGKSGKELREITGIPTATFVNASGYVGGAETLEDTILMAEMAVKA